jgi:hypothetical protein
MTEPGSRRPRRSESFEGASESQAAATEEGLSGTEVTKEQVNDAYIQGAINADIDGIENSVYARQPKRPAGRD